MENRIIEWVQSANFNALESNLEALKNNKNLRVTVDMQGNNVTLHFNLLHLVIFSFSPKTQEEKTRVEKLIDFMVLHVGISVNDVNEWNETPLILATKLHRYSSIKYLVETYMADIEIVSSKDNRTAMMTSLETNLDADFSNPFYFDIALYFLRDKNANVKLIVSFGFNCLHIAVSAENVDAVYFLVRNKGRDFDLKARINNPESSLNSFNALDIAARYNFYDLIDTLVQEARINPNETNNKGDTPFMTACIRGFVESCEKLQENQAVLIIQNPLTGMTNLHVSCSKGYVQITNIILEDPVVRQNFGDFVNVQTRKGLTALHLASIPSKPSFTVEILLSELELENALNENAKVVDTDGRTALHFACLKNLAKNYAVDKSLVNDELIGTFSKNISELLLSKDPDLLNMQDRQGRTALMLALKYDLKETVRFLMTYWDTLDTDLVDASGLRACDYIQNKDEDGGYLYYFLKSFMQRKQDLTKTAVITRELFDLYIKNKNPNQLVFFSEWIDAITLEKEFLVFYQDKFVLLQEMQASNPDQEVAALQEITIPFGSSIKKKKIFLIWGDLHERLVEQEKDVFWIVDSGEKLETDNPETEEIEETETANVFLFRSYFVDETITFNDRLDFLDDNEDESLDREDESLDREEEDLFVFK